MAAREGAPLSVALKNALLIERTEVGDGGGGAWKLIRSIKVSTADLDCSLTESSFAFPQRRRRHQRKELSIEQGPRGTNREFN